MILYVTCLPRWTTPGDEDLCTVRTGAVVESSVLFERSGSGVSESTVAVLSTAAVTVASAWTSNSNHDEPPSGSVPPLESSVHATAPGPAPRHVHVSPLAEVRLARPSANVRPPGRVSSTATLRASEGPAFATSMRNRPVPFAGMSTETVDLVSDRSALVAIVSEVSSVLLSGSGSGVVWVTVAVLSMLPVVVGNTVALTTRVSVQSSTPRVVTAHVQTRTPPTVTGSQLQPVPDVVTLDRSTVAGRASVMTKGATATEGPWFLARRFHVMVSPAVKGEPTEVFTSSTSALMRTGSVASSVLLSVSRSGVGPLTVAVL